MRTKIPYYSVSLHHLHIKNPPDPQKYHLKGYGDAEKKYVVLPSGSMFHTGSVVES
jgi:hypothetical protein